MKRCRKVKCPASPPSTVVKETAVDGLAHGSKALSQARYAETMSRLLEPTKGKGNADGRKMRLLRQYHPGRPSGVHDLRNETEPGEPDKKAPVPSFSEEGEKA